MAANFKSRPHRISPPRRAHPDDEDGSSGEGEGDGSREEGLYSFASDGRSTYGTGETVANLVRTASTATAIRLSEDRVFAAMVMLQRATSEARNAAAKPPKLPTLPLQAAATPAPKRPIILLKPKSERTAHAR